MHYLTDRLFSLSDIASPGPNDGFPNETGWCAAGLLIAGVCLALASLAWFLIGLVVN
jgi:hypothetical protein